MTIFLSNALPKTASTLIANYQESLLKMTNNKLGQEQLRAEFNGRFISFPTQEVLENLVFISNFYGDIVVKCHWSINQLIIDLLLSGELKVTFSYRDPRDIVLSAIDHGKRSRKGLDPSLSFADCQNIDDTAPKILKMLDTFNMWETLPNVHFISYENLMTNPFYEIKKMINFFEWKIPTKNILQLIKKQEDNKHQSHNFNKGIIGRWKEEMSEDDKKATTELFYPFLKKMGYETNINI